MTAESETINNIEDLRLHETIQVESDREIGPQPPLPGSFIVASISLVERDGTNTPVASLVTPERGTDADPDGILVNAPNRAATLLFSDPPSRTAIPVTARSEET